MKIDDIKRKIVTNVYHIPSDKKVPLHKHEEHNEVFYCIKGEGFGVLESNEEKLTVGKVFTVPADTMHALRSDSEMFVTSFLIPVIEGEITVDEKDEKKDEEKEKGKKKEKQSKSEGNEQQDSGE
jgi:quercetin dioxygenase-like cupin family protein